MAPLNCCGFRRNVSPDPQPVRLVDTPQRFALSSHSITPVETIRNAVPTQDIIASTSEDDDRKNSSATSGQELLPLHDTEASIARRHSSRRLHDIASQVKKRVSRDSGLSKRSSKRALRTSISFEDTERRAELKRALHKRVKNSLLDDSTTADDRYDEDAVAMKTPKASWGRHEGSIQISPEHLSNVLRRSDSPSRSLRKETHQREMSEPYSANNAANILSRMLTQRAGQLSEKTERNSINEAVEALKGSQLEKYVFDNEQTPKTASHGRSESPLERSNTVVHAAPNTRQFEPRLSEPRFLYGSGAPSSPDLLPSPMPSIGSSVANSQWCPPSSTTEVSPFLGSLAIPKRPRPASTATGAIYDSRIRPASENWLHGASRLFGPSTDIKDVFSNHLLGHERRCNPDHEEADFGGVDGKEDSPSESIYHTAKTRSHSEGNEPSRSAHIYNTHIPSRLASKALLPSASLPQLQVSKRQRSFTSEGSDAFSVKSRQQSIGFSTMNSGDRTLSSGLPSPKIPLAWDNPHWRASSSIYASKPESLVSSHPSSLGRIASLHDRLQKIKACTPSEEIISVPASRRKSLDLDRLEQQASDVSYQSSNESLLQQELAAAETRIALLPRSNTLPKNSRFREELDQISAELALSNPVRRKFSDLDGSGDWNGASQAISDKEANSIWERALREHSREDAALTHTRLGSELPDGIGPKDRVVSRSASARKASNHPPFEGTDRDLVVAARLRPTLQERLASYRLPTPTQKPVNKPVAEQTQRATSLRSTSSWARYPAHSRSERSSSPAGEQDQVFARDFANMVPTVVPRNSPTLQSSEDGREKEATSFGKQMLSSIKHIYHVQSRELQRRLANEARGHRSSISEGGMTDYPELEMVGGFGDSPLPPPDVDATTHMEEVIRKASLQTERLPKKRSSRIPSPTKTKQPSKEDKAKAWSKLYADCVILPGGDSEASAARLKRSMSEHIRPKDAARVRKGGVAGGLLGSGSSSLRASTLDFKRSLELSEGRARERVLGMVKGGEAAVGNAEEEE